MKSIRGHLAASLLVGLLAVLTAGGAALYGAMRLTLTREFDGALLAKAHALVQASRFEHGQFEFDFVADVMPEFVRRERAEYFQISDADGQVLERSRSLGDGVLSAGEPVSTSPVLWGVRLPDGRPGRALGLEFTPQLDLDGEPAVREGGAPRPDPQPVHLIVARGREDIDRPLSALLGGMAIAAVLLVSGTVYAVHRAVTTGLSPVREFVEQVCAIDAPSLSARVSAEATPAELAPVGAAINDLLGRLEGAFQRERRFSAGVAHELRTPIAELRSLTEVAARWPDDHERAGRAVRHAFDIAAQMQGMVAALLTLARAQSGEQPLELEPVEVRAAVEGAWARLAVRAGARGVTMRLDVAPGLSVVAEPAMLGSIAYNLLDNAVEYSPAGARIACLGAEDQGTVTLHVRNPAPELTPGDLARLFEPFWRKDAARTGGGRVGLGLALVKSLVETMGGTVGVDHGDGELTVSVHLPAPGGGGESRG